jgi:hypothetical protein
MIYCKKCITPNTRPGLTLDDEGVCQGCRYFETLKNIDWSGLSKENLTNSLKKISKYPMNSNGFNNENKVTIKSPKDIYRHNNKKIISDDKIILFDKGFINKIKGN